MFGLLWLPGLGPWRAVNCLCEQLSVKKQLSPHAIRLHHSVFIYQYYAYVLRFSYEHHAQHTPRLLMSRD